MWGKIVSDPYFNVPGLSVSGINAFYKSPAHYWRESPFNKERVYREATPAMLLGKVAHKLILEYDTFDDEFVVAPKCDKRTTVGKTEFAVFEAQSKGKTVVAEDVYLQARSMFEALQRNNAVKQLLSTGESELPLMWHNGHIQCKGKMDRYREGLIIDYKTTEDASESGFSKSIALWGYHRQDAWYMDGVEAVYNERPRGFVFIVQEKDNPENIGIYSLLDQDRELGALENESASIKIAERLQTGNWKSYPEMIVPVALPAYYKR